VGREMHLRFAVTINTCGNEEATSLNRLVYMSSSHYHTSREWKWGDAAKTDCNVDSIRRGCSEWMTLGLLLSGWERERREGGERSMIHVFQFHV